MNALYVNIITFFVVFGASIFIKLHHDLVACQAGATPRSGLHHYCGTKPHDLMNSVQCSGLLAKVDTINPAPKSRFRDLLKSMSRSYRSPA